MRRMGVLGVRVRVSEPEHDVLVVLDELDGDRSLPIVIGPHEGVAIASAQAGVRPARPGPHELVLAAVAAAGSRIERVSITALRESTFIAELRLANGAVVDARASDAITLALRAGLPLWCEDAVLAEAGLTHADDGEGHVHLSGRPEDAERAVAQFRDFLDVVEPEDFEA